MVRIKNKNRCHGTTTVEAAIVFPLLLLLTLGIIQYGWLFLKAHQTTNAARHGARIAIRADATNSDVLDAIGYLMEDAGLGGSGYSVQFSPIDVSSVVMGGELSVQISVPGAKVSLFNVSFLPTPEVITAKVVMAKEGP